jgi:SHS2 domain-containing protein
MIRMLDHTADVGFELGATTLESLFEEGRRALLLTVFERPPQEGREERVVRLTAPDREILLVRWLNELVFLVQDEGFVPARADVRIEESGGGFSLEAILSGTPLELKAHGWQGEVKSATFHGLDVTNESGGWRARVILDV